MTSYSEQQNAARAERDAREQRQSEAFEAWARAVLDEIRTIDGRYHWTIDIKPDLDNRPATRCTLNRYDGLAIHLNLSVYKQRIHASPSVPKRDGGYSSLRDWGVIPYGESGPSANINPERAPKIAARDIWRRVIAPYAPLYAEIVKKAAEIKDANVAGNVTLEWLKQLLGPTGYYIARDATFERTTTVEIHTSNTDGPSVHFRVYRGGGFDIERMSGLSDAGWRKLAKLIVAERDAGRAKKS